MVRMIKYQEWDETLQDHVERPLDTADAWTISLARLINGRDLTDVEFHNILQQHKVLWQGVDNSMHLC